MATSIGNTVALADFSFPDFTRPMKEVRQGRGGRGRAYLFSLLKHGQPVKTAGSSRSSGTLVSMPVGCKKLEPAHYPQNAAHLVKPIFSKSLASVICQSEAGMPLRAGPKSSGKVRSADELALAAARRIANGTLSNVLASVALLCCLAPS